MFFIKTKGDLRQCLHDRVQQSPDTLGHLEQLEDPGDPEDPHHADDGGVDGEHLALDLLQSDADDGEEDNGHVQLVPSTQPVSSQYLVVCLSTNLSERYLCKPRAETFMQASIMKIPVKK